MSLTFNSEHLAWKQRVFQEKTRKTQFHNTFSEFPKVSETSKSFKPYEVGCNGNYRTFQYNLGYCFGGTKHIKNAHYAQNQSPNKYNSKTKNFSSPPKRKFRSKANPALKSLEKELREAKFRCSNMSESSGNYIKILEDKLRKETMQRIKTEDKLRKLTN